MMNRQKSISNDEEVDIEKIGLKVTNFDLKSSKLSLIEIKWLISEAHKFFKQQSTVLHLSTPLKIVGDVCGHYEQLIKIFEIIGNPANKNYLFLGNYIAKGPSSIESLITLLYFKIRYPQNFFMLRGRFQTPENNYIFGFYEECLQKYDFETWNSLNELFSYLPLGATVQNQIFCMSSGLTPSIKTINQLNNVVRNSSMTEIPQIIDFLESKPKKNSTHNAFSTKSIKQFSIQNFFEWINENKLSLVIRSNEILEQGFQFSMKNVLLTICSIPNFLNVENNGAIVTINQDLVVSFQILK